MTDYPHESDLQRIRDWSGDHDDLADAIGEIWNIDCGVCRCGRDRLVLVTGGWSGNEEIIEALQRADSGMWWIVHWEKSERGGRYEFDMSRGREK